MTTTEAIKQLQTEHDLIAGERDLDGSQFAPALLEALAMAIEVMQGDGDTISRKAAIDETWKEPTYTDPLNVLTEVRDRIKALPSARPERPNGEWILSGENTYTCSVCGKTIITNKDYIKEHKWCFGCGTKMGKRKGADE